MHEIVCLSQMNAKEGHEQELRKALDALIPLTLEEPECLAYEVWQDTEDPSFFIVYERFTNKAALDAHINTPYVQEFIRSTYSTCVASHWDRELRKF